MVVLFHRNIRPVPGILSWCLLVTSSGLRRGTDDSVTTTAIVRYHFADRHIRYFQTIPKYC
jgi:hypothetical protein